MDKIINLSVIVVRINKTTYPTIITGKSRLVNLTSPIGVDVDHEDLTIYKVRNRINSFEEAYANIDLILNEISIKTTLRKVFPSFIPPKRDWQARLGSKLDNIFRKTIDNTLSLSGYPIDMIRVKVTKDPRTLDIISRTITEAGILPIYFNTAFENLPLRRMDYDDTEQVIMTLDGTKLTEKIEVNCPLSYKLNREDLLFRILRDDYSERPVVLILQVKDELGTFGYSKLLHTKYILTTYDEKLPTKILEEVVKSTTKREVLKW
jgi:hypothetical protein